MLIQQWQMVCVECDHEFTAELSSQALLDHEYNRSVVPCESCRKLTTTFQDFCFLSDGDIAEAVADIGQ